MIFCKRKDKGSLTMLGDKRKCFGILYILTQAVDKGAGAGNESKSPSLSPYLWTLEPWQREVS